MTKQIYMEGGVSRFYKGLDSAITRQAVYCTGRLGIYFSLCDYLRHEVNGGSNLSSWQKVYSSLVSGGIGAMIGTPADLILIRIQSDSTLPPSKRRNYRNMGDALVRIIKEEGIKSCWKGCTPTILRAMVLNLSMLVTYDECKERLDKFISRDRSNLIWFLSSVISAGFASLMSLPFDNLKTKLQKMHPNSDGTFPYKGITDCALKTVRKEGLFGFWAGLPTYFARLGPHVMITLITSEFLKKVFM